MDQNLRPAQWSDLNCAAAERFAERPLLIEVAGRVLGEQWLQRHLSPGHDPLTLYLTSPYQPPIRTWTRPLAQVLVERYCLRHTLNLSEGEDFLSNRADGELTGKIDIDLQPVELLINECGPLLMPLFQRALLDYWSTFDIDGQTPWQWLADYLRDQLHAAIEHAPQDTPLSRLGVAAARQLQAYPDAALRSTVTDARQLAVSTLQVEPPEPGEVDTDLGSALLIEHAPANGVAVVYGMQGTLLPVSSRQALLTALADARTQRSVPAVQQVHISPEPGNAFQAQALGLLQQQLNTIDRLGAGRVPEFDALALCRDVDHITSLVDLCARDERQQRDDLITHLPAWLRNAHGRALADYSKLLIGVAANYHKAQGRQWLDGIDTAQDYAHRQIDARLRSEHPLDDIAAADILATNYQSATAAAGSPGSIAIDIGMTPVQFSLAQLAIGNLGLLKPGRISLSTVSGKPLPTWFSESYLRSLISQLDIGSHYPRLLQDKLLADTQHRPEREKLLTDQLRQQLPALAMDRHLRDASISETAVNALKQLFDTQPGAAATRWCLRPLGFVREPGAQPDYPRNTWLIEPPGPKAAPCLLYRPMHADTLLQFDDRLALLVAISAPGKLQDDLLERLPAEVRKYYAHGGFIEPHLFYPLSDTSAIPFGAPAPVRLSAEQALAEPGKALYEACAKEAIEGFRAHSATTAQARWESWKTLGWLLFNTVLPLAGSTLGKIAWLAQMEVALAEVIEPDRQQSAAGQQIAIVNLLVNIAILLSWHSAMQLKLEQIPEEPTLTEPALPPLPPAALPRVVNEPVQGPAQFSWSSAGRTLSRERLSALHALQASLSLDELGSAIPSGKFKGLYLHQDKLWIDLDLHIYRVEIDPHSTQMRIVGQRDENLLGPWLRRDELGRWQLDLGLRLRGGMPLGVRLARLREDNRQALQTLDTALAADNRYAVSQRDYLSKVAALVNDRAPDPILHNYLEKNQAFSLFWEEHLGRLEARNDKQVLGNFRLLSANALTERIHCEQAINRTLKRLYQPKRAQLLAVAARQRERNDLTDADALIAKNHLDLISPLLDQLLANSEAMYASHARLGRLASRGQPQVTALFEGITNTWGNPQSILVLRFLRLESANNRLNLVHPLNEDAGYWLDSLWRNIELGIGQRAKLFRADGFDDAEIKVKLLRSIEQQFNSAQRKLQNLRQAVTDADALRTLQTLQDDLQRIIQDTQDELAELPQFPPSRSMQQLRQAVPGLIDTESDGLLLAAAHSDADTTVQVEGAETKTAARTYRIDNEQWVEVRQEPTPGVASERSLKRLLKDCKGLLASARSALRQRQSDLSSNWLPVEIQEVLNLQRDRLRAQSLAIQEKLTRDNQTDETATGRDAALLCRDLDNLANSIGQKAIELRIAAALRQRPRMGELQFLLAHGRVAISRIGRRTQLAKVKGRPDDYLDEYAVSHQGRPLWYAHFHYPAMDTALDGFTAGHLKTAAQRSMAGQVATDSTSGLTVQVYRAPITAASAKVFFSA